MIIGGSFGGITSAYELRNHLGPDKADITLIAKDPRFTFIPSLTWVAVGSRSLGQISFELGPALSRQRVAFVNETVEKIDLEAKLVITKAGRYPYDYLIVATGHRSANEAVEGLGPFDGPGHSPMSPPEASELATAIEGLLESPGPIVIRVAPGASCIGPAYELAFGIDHYLRRRGLRSKVPIHFITAEPYLGHMGMGGAGKIRQLLEGELEEHDIPYKTSAAIKRITTDSVEVEAIGTFPSVLSIVIPPLAGVPVVASTPGLSNPKGFIPVNEHYRHPEIEPVYAVGVSVALPPAEETPVPVNFPKTGHMTEQMAKIAVADIVREVSGKPGVTWDLQAKCVMDLGDKGAYMSVNPVRPPRNRVPTISDGPQWLVAKKLFEKAYLWHAKRGRLMPTALGW